MVARRDRRSHVAWIGLQTLEPRQLLSGDLFTLVEDPNWSAPIGDAAAVQPSGSDDGSVTGADGTTSNLSTFDIVILAGAGLSSNAAALAAFERAAAQWEAFISDPITVYITADLANLGSTSVIGQTGSVMLQAGYTTIRDAVVADGADEADDAIVAALPTSSQVTWVKPSSITIGTSLVGTKANLKALGFTGLDAQFGQSDATITFNSQFSFDYDNSNGVSSGTMDFETVASHEIGHALGFVSAVDTVDYYVSRGQSVTVNPYLLDLFRFGNGTAADPGSASQFTTFARDLRPGIDAVTDQIDTWNGSAAETRMSTGAYTGDGRQASHWKDNLGLGILDPTLSYGEVVPISYADLRAFDLIGWDIVIGSEPPPPPPPGNTAPVANNDTAAANEDAVLTVAAPGVLGNDTDADGDALSVSGSGSVSAKGAAVTVNANGGYSYDPRASGTLQALKAGQTTTDTFTYTVSDGKGGTANATVTVTVTGANDAPVAVNDSASVNKKTKQATGNVLSNDSDIDANTLTAQLVTGPTKGTLTLNANGSFTYTAGSTFNGTDSFTYRAFDGTTTSNVATVTITGAGGGGGGKPPRGNNLVAALIADWLSEDTSDGTVNVLSKSPGIDLKALLA